MRSCSHAIGLLMLTLAAVPLAAGQTPVRDVISGGPIVTRVPVGTATLSGTVISLETGRPLRNARVVLQGSAGAPDPRKPVAAAAAADPAARGVGPGMITPATRNAPAPVQVLSVSRTAFTDAQGQFTFARLAAGNYGLTASRDGYLQTSYGSRRPNAGALQIIRLEEGQQQHVALALSRGGVIAGTVIDEDGEPMASTEVSLWRFDRSTGVPRLQRMNGAQSNDRGAYRFHGLQPGRYLVSATPRVQNAMPEPLVQQMETIEQAIATGTPQQQPGGGPAFVTVTMPQRQGTSYAGPLYVPVFFPGTTDPAAASVVTLTGGEEHDQVHIPVLKVRATVVQGTIQPPPPADMNVQVSLVPLGTDQMAAISAGTTSFNSQNGMFVIPNVVPGRYQVLAQTSGQFTQSVEAGRVVVDGRPLQDGMRVILQPTARDPARQAAGRLWGSTEIAVNGEPTVDVSLTMRPARTVSGIVVFDTRNPAPPARQTLLLQVAPGSPNIAGGGQAQAQIEPDGTFAFQGVIPGRYTLRGPAMHSAILNGQELLDTGLEVTGDRDISGVTITITDRVSTVTGRLTDASGAPVAGAFVVVAPTDHRYWEPGSRRVTAVTTAIDGRYRVMRLPPGDYVLGVVDDLENGAQYDPEFLETLAEHGTRITVPEEGPVERDLRRR